MLLRNLFKKHAKMEEARREVIFWVATPAGVIVALLALLGALQSPNVTATLNVSFDVQHQIIVNHSLWWIICTNITGALLIAAVIFWFISLYFDYKSIRHLLSFTRSKRSKYRQQHHLLWIAASLVAVPTILVIMWYAIGTMLQYLIAPSTGNIASNGLDDIIMNYWDATWAVFDTLILLIPILAIVAIYLLVKRSRL